MFYEHVGPLDLDPFFEGDRKIFVIKSGLQSTACARYETLR